MGTIRTAPAGDRNFETRHADAVIRSLEEALAAGLDHVVFELRPSETEMHPAQFDHFRDEDEALDHWEMKTTGGDLPGDNHYPVHYRRTGQLLEEIRSANAPQPEYMIGDTIFRYSAYRDVLIHKGNPLNEIPMGNIWEDHVWSQFFFDKQAKNVYRGSFPNGERPSHVALAIMPTLPYCAKLGIKVEPYKEKAALDPTPEVHRTKRQKGRRIS